MTEKFPNGLAVAMERAGMGPTELARRLNQTKQDVSRWAKGERRLPPEVANIAAPILNTSAAALLLLTEAAPTRVFLGGRIGAGGAIDTSTDQSEPSVQYEVETMVQVPDASIAYQVVGDSMLPIFEPDTVIICRAHTQDVAQHIGRRVAVGTVEHGRQLKILHQGSRSDLFDLISLNQAYPTMRDVKVEWVARIAAIIPADEWRIIERRIQVEAANGARLKKPSQRRRSV
ncbi:S24 family peptidase [Methylobacterium phyllosphaerae]|nr:S24 family peptidase [Methylobacterium phyllosphaerae]